MNFIFSKIHFNLMNLPLFFKKRPKEVRQECNQETCKFIEKNKKPFCLKNKRKKSTEFILGNSIFTKNYGVVDFCCSNLETVLPFIEKNKNSTTP